MKGGYQILDLTGATAGSPVEVKGIYKAASGNNGKPVLILTNDGQRVYAEIAEDDGDFITSYISAEGKTVNITIKSDDSVTTVISDPGASIAELEQAVNELNSKITGTSVAQLQSAINGLSNDQIATSYLEIDNVFHYLDDISIPSYRRLISFSNNNSIIGAMHVYNNSTGVYQQSIKNIDGTVNTSTLTMSYWKLYYSM